MCGSSPKPPDPYKTADAQYQYNVKAAQDAMRMSAIDQFGPFGSTTYTRDDKGLPTSQTVNLSPEVEQWLQSQFGASTALQNAAQTQLGYLPQDRFELPDSPTARGYSEEAFGAAMFDPANFDTSGIASTSYEQAKSLFQPDIDAAKKQAEIRLKQRGINPGDEIYNDEMDRLDRNAANAYSGAARQATLDAGNEQTRRVNAALSGLNYGSNTYQTNLSNELLERNQPYAEAAALLGTTPQFQTPSFMNTPQANVGAPDYQGQVNANYQAKLKQNEGLWNTLGGIGSAFAGSQAGSAALVGLFSDENMKEDRMPADGEAILLSFRDMPVDDWNYTDEARMDYGVPGGRMTGPMAQDWAEEFGGDGKTINTVDALGKLMAAMKALDARTRRAA